MEESLTACCPCRCPQRRRALRGDRPSRSRPTRKAQFKVHIAIRATTTHSSSIPNTVHGSQGRSLHPQVLVDDDGLLVGLIGQLINESLDEWVHGCNGAIGQLEAESIVLELPQLTNTGAPKDETGINDSFFGLSVFVLRVFKGHNYPIREDLFDTASFPQLISKNPLQTRYRMQEFAYRAFLTTSISCLSNRFSANSEIFSE